MGIGKQKRSISALFIIVCLMVLGFQNCGRGFQSMDASGVLSSAQGTNTDTGSGANVGTGNGGSNGNAWPTPTATVTVTPVPTSTVTPTPTATVTPGPGTGAGTGPVAPNPATARFISVHQTQLKISAPPAAGSYEYPAVYKVGFKQQYSPEGISGCAIGFNVGGCAFPGGGSLALPEFTGYKLQSAEFKVFIPVGAKSLMLAGYAPQGAVVAFAMRFGAPPTRTAALSGAEYSSAQVNEKIDQSFYNLVRAKSELLVVHDGGGTVRFVGGGIDNSRTPITESGWLYIRQINGTPLYDIQGGIDVDLTRYAAGYNTIQWTTETNSDPY